MIKFLPIMIVLFISFMIAVGAAIGLVFLSKAYQMDNLMSTIFPLVPFLYAIIYQVFEKNKEKAAEVGSANQRTISANQTIEKKLLLPTVKIFNKINLWEILLAIFISLLIRIVFEVGFVFAHLKFSGQDFSNVYGEFSLNTILIFLKSEHPWFVGNEVYYLVMQLIILIMTSIGTGIWIGYTTKGNAILVGVIVGSIATMFNAATNMSLLYMKLEEMTNALTKSVGLSADIGLITVMGLQVLFYGFWSGIAKQEKSTIQKKKK